VRSLQLQGAKINREFKSAVREGGESASAPTKFETGCGAPLLREKKVIVRVTILRN